VRGSWRGCKENILITTKNGKFGLMDKSGVVF